MSPEKTIIALSTPPGLGAIAIIRLSGQLSLKIVSKIISLKSVITPMVSFYTKIYAGEDLLDDAIVTYYKAPRSYTGEDAVEISCHGSPYIINKIIEMCLMRGATLAQPGEFTRRAFINGKMDLSQAEAVSDLVFSQTQAAHKVAIEAICGSIGQKITVLRNNLVDLISILELELDFSENEIDATSNNDLARAIDNVLIKTRSLIKSYSCGKILKRGVLIPIVGPPNSGKSSLLNAFLNEERAIVTPFPGTTRDTLEEAIQAGGHLLRLLDTAGIRTTNNHIEKIGINRTLKSIQRGDIVLFVIDASKPIKNIWKQHYIKNRNTIIVINKIDIIKNDSLKKFHEIFAEYSHVFVSAKKHTGLHELTKMILDIISDKIQTDDSVIISDLRHLKALQDARRKLSWARKQMVDTGRAPEIIIADLRLVLDHFDEILGKTTNDDILNNIFNKFCIGK
ncbi:MAG: tRNA uridine-5-carboxymethylaminomethyl(34) synthesis GTPase MnmE [Candidatus Neomarinimicrobiota bacterium]